MKLRNKKTGKIQCYDICLDRGSSEGFGRVEYCYDTIEELNDEWEDYNPVEPLIKDEKIRKAVRAWAESNDYIELMYDKDKDCVYSPYGSDDTDTTVCISFDDTHVFEKLEHRKLYTITELCGEEE